MSFDLYFCWPNRHRINFDAVKEWAGAIKYVEQREAQLWYANPETGVYFSIDFEVEAPKSPDDGPQVPADYFDSGLSFNLNYNRPSYFSFEAMPVVEKLVSRFGLSVINPQENLDGSDLAIAVDSDSLIQSWMRHNGRAIHAVMNQPNSFVPLSMPAAASLYLWRYAKAKGDLERTCGEKVFVPSLFPVQKKGDKRAYRASVYTEGLPTIVPECDWVFVVRQKKRLFRSKGEPEVTAISVDTFHAALAGCISPFRWQPDVQLISPESAEKAGKMIQAVERSLPRSEFEVLGMDSFVDIDLPQNPATLS